MKKTGWPPGMLQDDCRGLSQWLSNKPDAYAHARDACRAIQESRNMETKYLPTVLLNDDAHLPTYQTALSAAMDLRATHAVTILPGEFRLVKTGLSISIPAQHVGLICSRSGLALKNGVFVLNAPGVIDADYRGEIGVVLMNVGGVGFIVNAGDRIAQIMFVKYEQMLPVLRSSLDETARGAGGFGSTGVAT